jgi:hypothetical protein
LHVNCNASFVASSMESYSIEEYQWVQHVNADAAMVWSLAVVPGMRAKGFGQAARGVQAQTADR